MSLFLPYNVEIVISFFTTKFGLDLTTLTSYEQLTITILANIYFYIYWGFIIYIGLKIFNRIWERIF